VPGDGRYPIQPVHVEDVAAIAVGAGRATENVTLDAAGPEIFAFNEFVGLVRQAVGAGRWSCTCRWPPRWPQPGSSAWRYATWS